MKFNPTRQGEILVLTQSSLWALFPVITILTYNQLPPLVSLGVSTLFAAAFFALVLTLKKGWHQIFNKYAIKDILFGTFILGIIYYTLYFFGLRFTSPGNVSIIGLTEIFFSYIFFHIFKKQSFPKEHIIGATFMIIGALIVLYPNLHNFQPGDLLVLLATFIAPLGNYFVLRARKVVASETIMFIRSIISGVLITIFAYFISGPYYFTRLYDSFFFLAINGLLILGLSKALWIEGIHRIPVTKANALASISPLLTLFFAWLILKTPPSTWQIFSFVPIFFGILLLGVKNKLTNQP